jgi:predicted alpha/beta-hydrolase family hydrolase
MPAAETLSLAVNDGHVSALWLAAPAPTACFVFAHGAGAGMAHSFMAAFAEGLAARRVATLRYQFPYMEKKSGRPDAPAVCHATVRAAVDAAAQRAPGLELIAGGKSFGGRMTSQAQALRALPGVRGLVFLGFPLHAAGKPAGTRAAHLSEIRVPMLFLQGDKDKLAERTLLEPIIAGLGRKATLIWAPDADHAFHVPKRSGRTDAAVLAGLLDSFADWAAAIQSDLAPQQ